MAMGQLPTQPLCFSEKLDKKDQTKRFFKLPNCSIPQLSPHVFQTSQPLQQISHITFFEAGLRLRGLLLDLGSKAWIASCLKVRCAFEIPGICRKQVLSGIFCDPLIPCCTEEYLLCFFSKTDINPKCFRPQMRPGHGHQTKTTPGFRCFPQSQPPRASLSWARSQDQAWPKAASRLVYRSFPRSDKSFLFKDTPFELFRQNLGITPN